MKDEHPTEQEFKEKREALRRSYALTFSTEHGRAVLQDLMRNFGFNEDGIERSSTMLGIPPNEVYHREGTKEPVRRILFMSGKSLFKPETK